MILVEEMRRPEVLFKVVAAGFVVPAAIFLAQVTWHLAGQTGRSSPIAIEPMATITREQLTDVAPILALAPFGSPLPEPSAVPLERGGASMAGLVLHGVLLAQQGGTSRAMISASSDEVKTYSTGQRLPGGAILDEVSAGYVVLRVGEQRRQLRFARLKPATSQSSGAAAIRAQIPASVRGTAAPAQAPTPDAVIESYRRQIADNPQTVLDNLGVAATPQGYRIGKSPSAGVVSAGLRAGDVVVRVNGAQVGNIQADRRLYDQIVSSGRARVEVMRGGKLVIMSFPLR